MARRSRFELALTPVTELPAPNLENKNIIYHNEGIF